MPILLSPNFTLTEFTRSQTASRIGLDNSPPPEAINRLKDLCVHVLQPMRDHFKKPIIITSGYRSQQLNREMGGAPTSQHTRGEAADIEIPGIANADLWRYIAEHLTFDQVIAEYLKKEDPQAGWIHVSYRFGCNRKEAISCIGRGKYVSGLRFI